MACCSGKRTRLIFACSGGSDVGELADRACRRLATQGKGQMYCLAGVGGNVPPIVKTTEDADELVALDGCAVSCASATLRGAGFDRFLHVVITELGFQKGAASSDESTIDRIARTVKTLAIEEGRIE